MGGGTGTGSVSEYKMNEEIYDINGKKVKTSRKFLIDNEKKYDRMEDFLNNQEGLTRLNERDDLIFYAIGKGFIVIDKRDDLNVEVWTTKNIDRKIKKSLEKISGEKAK